MKTKFYLLTAGLLAAVMVFAQPSGSGKSGKFSVAAGVQVRFAQGNLQFNPSQGTHATAEGTASGTWRFAEQQYESFQDENVNIVNAGYNGWLDLFGWGTSGYNSCSPLTYLPDATYGDGNLDIAGTYYDWGVYNAISNGGNKVGLWRTLTESEWEYLTLNRANAANLWSLARVNNIDGLLILPDDWSLPSGLSFSPQQQYPSHNAYTLEQWQQMENAGAVFLPAEGYRSYNTSTSQVTVKTNYRRYSTSSCATATQRYTIVILPFTATPAKNWKRDKNEGWAVRLARTIEEYTVVFKDWDGTVLSNGNVEYGFAATPPANPTREGFTFTSWGPSVSGMNVNYITGEVVFTAQYEKYITYPVTFVDGLTGDVISTLTKEQGATLTLSERPSTPTHDGNIFEGWFLPNGTAPISTALTVNSNMTITARFTWDSEAGVLVGSHNPSGNKFSIGADRQVVFSQGNLQYQPSTGKWQFAADQYTTLPAEDNQKLTVSSYTGWVDVFTWSCEGAEYGLTTCVGYPATVGEFVEWGDNPISNGGNKARIWRTLSYDEWTYILSGRTNASSLTFQARLTGKNSLEGVVILPDGWKSIAICNSLLSSINYSAINDIDADDWSVFEAYGALFFPETVYAAQSGSTDMWLYGSNYWTKTYNSSYSATWGYDHSYALSNSGLAATRSSNRCPVRLARYEQDCPEISSEFSAEAVGCYTWEGKVYKTSGDYRRVFESAGGCDSIVTLHLTISDFQPAEGSGALEGLFSVSATSQVRFSKGDLQYQPITATWRFASEQFDIVGTKDGNFGWRDLFGWSTTNSQFGLGTNFTGDFVDWGENEIANGGNHANRWRTLTATEWNYLRNERPNASNLYFTNIKIEGITGSIYLPDDWTAPAGVTIANNQSYSRAEWKTLENAGAVFVSKFGFKFKWSSTSLSADNASDDEGDGHLRSALQRVRLVQEPVKPVGGTLKGRFSVSADKQVLFSQGNLQYQASTNTWKFAEHQTDYIGEDNDNVSPTYDGWIDLFGWGTGNDPTNTTMATNAYQTFVDWGINAISNGGNTPNVWRTLSENEWTYIFERRSNHNNLKCLATINGVKALILLPDDWVTPSGISLNATTENTTTNIYTTAEWTILESAGAILLPLAGRRCGDYNGRNYCAENVYGAVWSSSGNSIYDDEAGCLEYRGEGYNGQSQTYVYVTGMRERWQGLSVRLARDFVLGEDCVPVYTSFSETVCDNYTWNGVKYTSSGNYQRTFTSANGCDSVVTLHLTINPSYEVGFGEETTSSYTWEGTTYNTSGDYTKNLQTAAGCDSIVTLHLTIAHPYYVAGNGGTGNSWCNGKYWNAAGSQLVNGEITFNDVPAGIYEFKITNGKWHDNGGTEWAFGALNASCSSPNVLNGGSDENGNIKLVTTKTQDITIAFDGTHICVTGEFSNGVAITSYTIVGDYALVGAGWDTDETENDMTETSSGVFTLVKTNRSLSATAYAYKVVGNHSYSAFEYPTSGNNSLTINAAGKYDVTFTFTPASSTLTAEAVLSSSTGIDNTAADAIVRKEFRNGQLLIEKNGKVFNALGIEVK